MNTSGTGFLRSHTRRQDDRRTAERRADESLGRLTNKVVDAVVIGHADEARRHLDSQKDGK